MCSGGRKDGPSAVFDALSVRTVSLDTAIDIFIDIYLKIHVISICTTKHSADNTTGFKYVWENEQLSVYESPKYIHVRTSGT